MIRSAPSRECRHDAYPAYERLIGPLRSRARELGYALGVHGSLRYDVDLIACPWTSEAVEAAELAQALLRVAAEVNGVAFMAPVEAGDLHHRAGRPSAKPHGRRGWCFHLGDGPYIDLSVMPRTDPPHKAYVYDDDGAWWTYPEREPAQFGVLTETQLFPKHTPDR